MTARRHAFLARYQAVATWLSTLTGLPLTGRPRPQAQGPVSSRA